MLFFSGIGTALAVINPDYHTELKNVMEETGPTLAGRAFEEIRKGNRVNLGEGYFGNSTIAEDTEVYKELVGRGANPDEVRDLLESLQDKKKSPIDLRRSGIITIFIGAGLFMLGWIAIGEILKGVGVLVGLIGVGQMVAGYVYPNQSEEINKVVEEFEKK